MTLCVAECCGIDAYDFHPIHVASFLLLYRGEPNSEQIEQLRQQLAELEATYGSRGSIAQGVSLDDLNQVFSGEELDELTSRVGAAIDQALSLISQTSSTPFPKSHS